MSVKIMGQVWDLDLPANKLLVLLAMTDHADHNGENIYPSVELVAWKTGYSESQARRIIKALVKDGVLSSQPRPGRSTVYTVHLDKGKQKEPFKRSNTGYQIDTPSIAMTPQGLHSHDTPGGSIAMTPEPSLEPSMNHIPRKRDAMFDAIVETFGISAGGWVANLKSMMLGTAKRGEWARCNFNPPVTDPTEILAFKPYMIRRMAEKNVKEITACVTIQRWFYDFRNERDNPKNAISVLDGLRLVS